MPHSHKAADLSVDQQHVAILDCCDDLLKVLAVPSRLAEIGAIRMRLASLLQANLQREEAEIFGPIRSQPANLRPTSFDQLEATAADLRSRYSQHIGRWNWSAIQADSYGYATAAKHLILELQRHLRVKRALLPDWRQMIEERGLSRPQNERVVPEGARELILSR